MSVGVFPLCPRSVPASKERMAVPDLSVPTSIADFLVDTDLIPDPDVPGRYTVDLATSWNIFFVFGGMTMALALRAVERELGDAQLTPLTANALYVSAVTAGPIEIEVEVLRRGRAAAQVVARLRNVGDEGTALHLTAVFGRATPSDLDYLDIAFPDVPRADECAEPPPVPADSVFSGLNFHRQVDWRPTVPFDPATWTPGPAESTSWARLRNEPWRPDGTLDPISLPLSADHISMAISSRMGRQELLVLSLEIGLQFLQPATSPWVLQHARAPMVDNGFASAYVELWDGDRNLIGTSTQRAKLRRMTGVDLGPSTA